MVAWCFIWYYFCLGWLTWLVGFGNRGVVRGVVDYLRYCWLRHVVCVCFYVAGWLLFIVLRGCWVRWARCCCGVMFMVRVATPRL